MSRSYKNSPVCTEGENRAGTRKYWKRLANRKVRKAKSLGMKSKNYKKIYESWDICDYKFYLQKEHFVKCAEDLEKWKKYYHRK